MHEGMGGRHLFHVFVRSSDPEKPVSVLKVRADIVSLETWRRAHPNAFYLPRELTEFKLSSEIEGIIAEEQAYKIFGRDKPIHNAYLGRYRHEKKETHLLVAEYDDVKKAEEIFSKFVTRMTMEDTAAKVFKKMEFAHKDVYLATKGAREYYYFQNADQVVQLSQEISIGEECLLEVLEFMASLDPASG
jgi:hypothetical protein